MTPNPERMVARSFAAMPYRPAKLTSPDFEGDPHDLNMTETEQVVQTYIDCGYPGPSRFTFIDNVFSGWWPCLTYERAVGDHLKDNSQ